jgi:hypothetical protein
LSAEHTLRIDNLVFLQHVEQKGIGRIENERHTFPVPPDPEVFFLNQPDVIIQTIVVTDVNNNQTFVAGVDYSIVQNGNRTGIQRIIGGNIPQGATVLVDYDAVPTAAGSYESLTENFGFRLSLWKDLWSIYARFSYFDNNAPSDIRVPHTTSYTVGTEANWRWASAGAEAVMNDSTDSSYRSARLFQSCFFNLDDGSSLGFDFSQSFTDYTDSGRNEQQYRFLSRYHRPLVRNLRFDCQTGANLTYGQDVEQTVYVARPELNYVIGRTTIQLLYNFEYNLYLNNQEIQKHYLFLRMKRSF